jgi:NTE family protein
MSAFGLSGGGNLGAVQAGALEVLREAEIYPEMLTGTSAGSLNATFLAIKQNREGAAERVELWRRVSKEDIFPGGPLRAALHFASAATAFSRENPLRPSSLRISQGRCARLVIYRSPPTSRPRI